MRDVDSQALDAIREIVASHDALATMNYKTAELGTIATHWSRVCSAMRDLEAAFEASGTSSDTDQRLLAHARRYISDYDFGRELDMIGRLYAGDPARLRGIGLKIVESLEERGLAALFTEVCNA